MIEARKSLLSSPPSSFCQSTSCRSQLKRSVSPAAGEPPSLYFQWAAIPYSATWCMSVVRIWTSIGRCRPITAVCRDW